MSGATIRRAKRSDNASTIDEYADRYGTEIATPRTMPQVNSGAAMYPRSAVLTRRAVEAPDISAGRSRGHRTKSTITNAANTNGTAAWKAASTR